MPEGDGEGADGFVDDLREIAGDVDVGVGARCETDPRDEGLEMEPAEGRAGPRLGGCPPLGATLWRTSAGPGDLGALSAAGQP